MQVHRLPLHLDRRMWLFYRGCGKDRGEGVSEFSSPVDGAENAEEIEVIFCCFLERDKRVFEKISEQLGGK